MFTDFFMSLLNDFLSLSYKSQAYRSRILNDIKKAQSFGYFDTVENGSISFRKIELDKHCGSVQLTRYDLRINTDEIKGVIEIGQHGYLTGYNFTYGHGAFFEAFQKTSKPEIAFQIK